MNLIEHRTYKLVLTNADLKKMISRYHFGDTDFLALERQYKRIANHISASVTYKIEEDMKSVSCAVTLGRSFDTLQDNYTKQGDMSSVYQLECLGMEFLNKAYQNLEETLLKENGFYVVHYDFPSEEDALLKSEKFLEKLHIKEIVANVKGTLLPKKSVFYRMILSKEKGNVCNTICEKCKNERCQIREKEEVV